jgi:hypothetical protein
MHLYFLCLKVLLINEISLGAKGAQSTSEIDGNLQ